MNPLLLSKRLFYINEFSYLESPPAGCILNFYRQTISLIQIIQI